MLNNIEQMLHDGSKELAQNDADSSKYVLSSENKVWAHTSTVLYNASVIGASNLFTLPKIWNLSERSSKTWLILQVKSLSDSILPLLWKYLSCSTGVGNAWLFLK